MAPGPPLVGAIFGRTGRAFLVGVTGVPGGGKSTLVDQLIATIRGAGQTVAVLAVDPTSPFSGGAVLGDRVRMGRHAADRGVFVRSMATRGHLGGLARATGDAALVLDAAGFDVILIETVGVGQDEVDVARTADATVVVLVPGTGDDVQAMKAGIMEIADVFVANKADREGIDRLVQSVEAALSLQPAAPGAWTPPVLKTEATTGRGVDELWATLLRFRERPGGGGRRSGAGCATGSACGNWSATCCRRGLEQALPPDVFEQTIEDVAGRRTDPYAAAHALVARGRGRARAAHESGPRSRRHRRGAPRRGAGLLPRRARPRRRAARGGGHAAGSRAHARHRAGRAGTARSHRGRLADCRPSQPARPGPAPRHAARGGPARGAGAAGGARRPARSTPSRDPARTVRSSRSSIPRRRTACSWS